MTREIAISLLSISWIAVHCKYYITRLFIIFFRTEMHLQQILSNI